MIIGPQHGDPLPESLSEWKDKLDLYAADTYFRESWEDLVALTGDEQSAADELHDVAAIAFKPDAIASRAIGPSLEWLDEQGFTPVAARTFRFDRHTTRGTWLYSWNVATRDRKDVVDLLLGLSPSLLVLLRGPSVDDRPATRLLSETKGPADPSRRRLGQLRYGLGALCPLLNFVHTADEPADLVRELAIMFDAPERVDLYRRMLSRRPLGDELTATVSQLEAENPRRDLTLSTTLAALGARLAGWPEDPQTLELGAVLRRVELGESRDWRGLLALIDAIGLSFSDWERSILSTHLVQMDTPRGELLLPSVSSSGKREHDVVEEVEISS